jgi:hypothetical protein
LPGCEREGGRHENTLYRGAAVPKTGHEISRIITRAARNGNGTRQEAVPYSGSPELAEAGITVGRDRFFEVLKGKGLLLDRLPGMPKTTDSRHSLPVFQSGQ